MSGASRAVRRFRRLSVASMALAVLVAACGWDPTRPFEREAPQVNEALGHYDAGEAGTAATLLQDYLTTGACSEGNIGTPLRVRERPNGSFDLGLALFKLAETYGHRFGDEENDAGLLDPNLKGMRAGQVECALRVVRAISEDPTQPVSLRARARYLEGNLLFLTAAYKEAVTAYDHALELVPAMGDAGPIGTNTDAGKVTYADDPVGPVHDDGVPAPYVETFRRADAEPKAATPKAAAKKAATRKAAGGGGQGEGMLNYLRVLQGVDDNVGRLLKALDDEKLADDTMVVFMSDNGYYLGEHRLGDKRSAYEESLRIPFYVRWPGFGAGRRGSLVDRMVLNIDLAPTILDLAGAPIPAAMQGRSWRALAEGREPGEPWRKAFFYEYYYEPPFAIPTLFALRTETAKLIVYPGHPDWEELFDLTADPGETRNLIHDESARPLRDDLRSQFDAQARALGVRIPAGDKDGPKP